MGGAVTGFSRLRGISGRRFVEALVMVPSIGELEALYVEGKTAPARAVYRWKDLRFRSTSYLAFEMVSRNSEAR